MYVLFMLSEGTPAYVYLLLLYFGPQQIQYFIMFLSIITTELCLSHKF